MKPRIYAATAVKELMPKAHETLTACNFNGFLQRFKNDRRFHLLKSGTFSIPL